MDEIVGKKSAGFAGIFIFGGLIIALLGGIAISIPSNKTSTVFGIALALTGGVLIIVGAYFILAIPSGLIAVNGTTIILLAKNQEIEFSEVESVFPRRARGKGIAYPFGTIIIKAKGRKTYKQGLVANVENVASELNKKLRKGLSNE